MVSLAIQAAKAFADTVHKNQKYGKTLPYSKHLEDVLKTLIRFGVTDDDMLVAALLHDSVEDTNTTIFQLEAAFGRRVSELVHCVTNEPGKNRKERHQNTYSKIAGNKDATTLKLADRISNLEYSIESQDDGKIKMYTKEYKEFRERLYTAGTHDAMWRHLDFLIGDSYDQPAL